MKTLLISIGIIINTFSKDHIELYLQKRSEEGPLDGFLEFPGGKFDVAEGPVDCLKRELQEEINIDISTVIYKPFQTISHTYPDRKVLLHFFLVDGRELSLDYTRIDFDNYPQFLHKIPEANIKIMENLREYIQSPNIEYLWK